MSNHLYRDRPKNLDLRTIRLPINALVSILHRLSGCVLFLLIPIILFTLFQGYEYLNASFNISDGIYGSTFYMATGLHGSHVIVGTVFIIVCLVREIKFHFTTKNHVGFEFASWYWHFVDVVWIFLYVFIYYWGSGSLVDDSVLANFFIAAFNGGR